jgi:hypothetical protein
MPPNLPAPSTVSFLAESFGDIFKALLNNRD